MITLHLQAKIEDYGHVNTIVPEYERAPEPEPSIILFARGSLFQRQGSSTLAISSLVADGAVSAWTQPNHSALHPADGHVISPYTELQLKLMNLIHGNRIPSHLEDGAVIQIFRIFDRSDRKTIAVPSPTAPPLVSSVDGTRQVALLRVDADDSKERLRHRWHHFEADQGPGLPAAKPALWAALNPPLKHRVSI
ncbi:hypothetical protein NL676_032635 [Syzygium grande]|nr:hypothetical protein NL676_032635 [Syzygium grande]